MTTPHPGLTEAVDHLAQASAHLATIAEQHGVSRAQTAAALAQEVTYAATTDPAVEKARAELREDLAAHETEVNAYLGRTNEIRLKLLAYLDRLAALADEVVAYGAEIGSLDERGKALTDRGLQLAESVGVLPSIVQGVVHHMGKQSQDGILLTRLFLSSQRGRNATIAALADLTVRLRPTRT